MPTPFQSLSTAVIANDVAAVKALLLRYPALATDHAEVESLEMEIFHWLYRGDTALHIAAAGHRVDIAKALLDAGAAVGADKNRRRSQPLHYAADGHLASPAWNPRNQVAMIRLLLEAGAQLDAQDKNGASPLHRAVRNRCAAAVKCLLDAGANPALKNKPGSTPFHLAAQNTGRGGSGAEQARAAQREIIQVFLDHGVNSTTLKDAQGKSVRDWAKSDWIREMLS